MGVGANKWVARRRLVAVAASATVLLGGGALAYAKYVPGIPAAVDPGTPTFTGLANPVPAEPVAYDPAKNMMQAIVDAGPTTNGKYWFDSILARPFSGPSGETTLFTRGRALYMYTHTPGTLGFAGGYAYRERPTGGARASTRSRSPARRSPRRPRRGCSTRATSPASTPPPGWTSPRRSSSPTTTPR